jgi:hemerythrin-like domain-containing protein
LKFQLKIIFNPFLFFANSFFTSFLGIKNLHSFVLNKNSLKMRYNIFYQIHKGLRALLYDTQLLLQQTDYTAADELAIAVERIELVVDLFEDHAHHEDYMILPAIKEFEPSVVDLFEQEHVKDHQLSKDLEHCVQALQLASSSVKPGMGSLLEKTFLEFTIFNLQHMAKEEDVLNKLLWRYYSDEDIKSIHHQILLSLNQQMTVEGSRWMMRGLNNADILNWLRQVEKSAPQEVFLQLLDLAKNELPADRFTKIAEAASLNQLVPEAVNTN